MHCSVDNLSKTVHFIVVFLVLQPCFEYGFLGFLFGCEERKNDK